MTPEPDYRGPFRRTLIALAACLAAVVVCYFWIDRPVAYFVHNDRVEKFEWFKWFTYPPPIEQKWSPLILVALMVRRAWGPFARWQKVLLVSCISLIVADQFRESLGDVCGRYWPETWHDNNPSLIGTGAYGFHPFVRGDDTGSFPSGHSARILGFAGVWWIAMPRSRALCVVIGLPMLLSLIALNYHFVSDVIAGSVLGGIVAAYAARLARLELPAGNSSRQPLGSVPP